MVRDLPENMFFLVFCFLQVRLLHSAVFSVHSNLLIPACLAFFSLIPHANLIDSSFFPLVGWLMTSSSLAALLPPPGDGRERAEKAQEESMQLSGNTKATAKGCKANTKLAEIGECPH